MSTNLKLHTYTDLIEYTGNILLECGNDIDKNLIVFPGKRPAHFLRKHLADSLKTSFKSPQIFSIDEFIDWVYENILGYRDTNIDAIDAVAIIFKHYKNSAEEILGNKNITCSFDNFIKWGFELFSDFEEMHIEMIESAKVKSINSININEQSMEMESPIELPDNIRKKFAPISYLYESFYKYLSENDLSTRSSRYKKDAEEIEKVIQKLKNNIWENIIFIGFYAVTMSETRILKGLSKLGNVSFIFQDGYGIEAIINKLDLAFERKENIRTTRTPEIFFHKATDTHGEVFSLGNIISRKENYSEKDTIVLPSSETLFPIIHNCLPDENNISMGYPLTYTPIYVLIQTLETLFDTRIIGKNKDVYEYFIPDYFKFILHPYIKNIYLKKMSDYTRIILHTIEEKLSGGYKRFIAIEEIENNSEIINTCYKKITDYDSNTLMDKQEIKNHLSAIHNISIKAFYKVHNIEDFCDKLLELIFFISERSSVNKHQYTPTFIRTTIETIDKLKSSFIKDEKFTDVGNYFKLLKSYFKTATAPFEGTPVKGLQVLGFLETRNIKFDNVYFLDVNEGIVPNTKKEDNLLPYGIRKYLGLPTYEDREKIWRYYFETLINGAKNVHIFYVQSADKIRSRFVERLIWDIQKERKDLKAIKQNENEIFFKVNFSQKDPLTVNKNSEIVKYLKVVAFDQTKLNRYLNCQLKFYYSDVLKLGKKEEITEGVENWEIGRIVHHILEDFFKSKLNKTLEIAPEDYTIIEKAVDDVFYNKYTSLDMSLSLIKRQIKKRCTDIIDSHKKNYQNIIIRETEKTYETFIILPSGIKVTIKGRFDRVDERNGEIYIVDYKTGSKNNSKVRPNEPKFISSTREDWSKTLKSVQMPFYVMLYLEYDKTRTEQNANSSLMLLGDKEIKEEFLFNEKMNDRSTIFQTYKNAIITLIEEILNPEIPFNPVEQDSNECSRCDFSTFCGRQWIVKKY